MVTQTLVRTRYPEASATYRYVWERSAIFGNKMEIIKRLKILIAKKSNEIDQMVKKE
jgi:hypothetical protein